MAKPFNSLLSRRTLRELAGDAGFDRGQDYADGGAVHGIVLDGDAVKATVAGTRTYRVELWAEDGELEGQCSCPVGENDGFCKHCVAVGLVWLGRGKRKDAAPAVTMDDVRKCLARRTKEELVDLVVAQAAKDESLHRRLVLEAAKGRDGGVDVAAYRAALDDAMDTGGFVDWRGMHDYAQRVEEAIDAVEELLKAGHPQAVIELAEHALRNAEEAMESIDDSDGHMGDILPRLQDLHHAACVAAKPDREALAKKLFDWEMSSDWEVFGGAAATYADVLGPEGLAAYRRVAEARWAKVPALSAGARDPEAYGRRFRIAEAMEALARAAGDVEALVDVMRRDLSHSYSYLRIAEAYREAGKHDAALEWAERGLADFPAERPDDRIRAFLVEEHRRRGRHDDAIAMVWEDFVAKPGLEWFRRLHECATPASRWTAVRERALTELRRQEGEQRRAPRNKWAPPVDRSELVRVFLWEKDDDSAWREAREGGCSRELWLDLAKRSEKTRPDDALSVYRDWVGPTAAGANNPAYEEAVSLLRKVRTLLARLGREEEFPPLIAKLRTEHHRKRNFLALLDRLTRDLARDDAP